MSRKLSKRELKEKRKKRLDNKIKIMEKQDDQGISRKKVKGTMRPELYVTLKIISIIVVPVVYIIYSPLLILCVIFSISLLACTYMTERYLNKTYIKKNHLKLPKFDSIIAIILLIITIFGTINGLNTKRKMPISNAWIEFKMKAENMGSCLTGRRSIFRDLKMMFSTVDVPANFQGRRPPKMTLENLPVEMVFSMIISSINSVLLVLIPISGGISIWIFKKKRNRFENKMNEVILDNYVPMSDEEITRLLMFGLEPIDDIDTAA